MGEILTKTYFSPQMYHIQLNYDFFWFWSIFVEIHRELIFLDNNLLSQKGALKLSESLFFNMFERVNPDENLNLFRKLYLIKPVKGDK